MLVKDLKGRPCTLPTKPYLIDWDAAPSRPQQKVQNFLRPYWCRDIVLAEARIPHCLFRLDLFNVSQGIVVEVSPESTHGRFNPFMHGSIAGWTKRLKADLDKERWATELNDFTFIELTDAEFPILSPELFVERWNVTLTPVTL